MTHNEAESVKDLAKPVVEALGVITERKCLAWHPPDPSTASEPCALCSGTGKVKWKWEPEPGQWCLYGNKLLLITKVTVSVLEVSGGMIEAVKADKVIPILSWETIEKVLEGVEWTRFEFCLIDGYKFKASSYHAAQMGDDCPVVCTAVGKSRQEAVMKAVIKLGEEKHD